MHQPIYLPFADGQWHLAMGLKPLQIQDWIEIDTDFANQLCLKNDLLTRRYAEVFASLPGSITAQQEVLELLLAHLLRYFPDLYQQAGDRLLNRVTNQVWQQSDFKTSPLDLAGRLVQEDLCLMLPEENRYKLAAASVCFPSHWRLQEKLGRSMAEIHQPIPGYAEKLERPVDHFFDRLKLDHPGYRLNWSIVNSPDLFLASSHRDQIIDSALTSENAGERLWLRVERQTLRRLAVSEGILFTIRTYINPLHKLVQDQAIARSLSVAIQQIPTTMQQYKNILPIRATLLTYLEQF